jgi:AraC-like DNA-binding protein/quercetin dioxygenase-like cupin family protein
MISENLDHGWGVQMSLFLEIPDLNKQFPFRSFINEGHEFVYPHWHKELEIIYVMKGNVNIGVNDRSIRLHLGEVYFINGGDTHYFLASSDSERLVIQLDLTIFQEIAAVTTSGKKLRDAFTEMKNSSFEWNHATSEQMVSLIKTIHDENTRRQEGSLYLIKAKLLEMIVLILREVPVKKLTAISKTRHAKTQDTLNKLDQVFSYVEAHYQETITLSQIAKQIGFSSFYFTKFFKRNMGTTFTRFINEYRLNKAKWILLNEDRPITEVAECAGFNSSKTLHHLFKQVMGISPSKYRKTISGNN